MKRVLLIQHEKFEPLGTLDPVLRQNGIRIKYVNFERNPEALPSLDSVDGLILMGGFMGVYESHKYPHLKVEMNLIEHALKKQMPILGICLGSQILAHVLGSHVRKHHEREMGWYKVHFTGEGKSDPLFEGMQGTETLFQSHGDTFDIPTTATHLAWSELCEGQAFRYGPNVYGLQFHLEIDAPTITAWLEMPENQEIFEQSQGKFVPSNILQDTNFHLANSMQKSTNLFQKFLQISGAKPKKLRLGSGR